MYERDDAICKKCHDVDTMNCIFCFCPLYNLDSCGGSPEWVGPNKDIKDCSNCIKPHTEEFVRNVLEKFTI